MCDAGPEQDDRGVALRHLGRCSHFQCVLESPCKRRKKLRAFEIPVILPISDPVNFVGENCLHFFSSFKF